MHRKLIATFLALSLLGAGAAWSQVFSRDQLRELETKVEAQLNAYWRLQLAEQEAVADGSPDRAASFREAKLKAYNAYMDMNARLKKAQLDRREYEKRQDGSNDVYR